ncbi:hypothetical protein PG985_014170 [Apiospora marii]|uniref:uncharacterized protein n=1 Tax=Apiospora marii TaxID=335849 RepID=UPI0031303F8C
MTIDEGNHGGRSHREEAGATNNVAIRGARRQLPLLVMSACPLDGHMLPTLHVARVLIRKGFEVIFMTSAEFRPHVEDVGAEWYEMPPLFPPGGEERRQQIPVAVRFLFDIEERFLPAIAARTPRMRALLEMLRERDPAREVLIVTESLSLATVAFHHGAPLPQGYAAFPKTIGLNVVPLVVSSVDTAPFGMGLPPDATESGRMRNQALHGGLMQGPFKHLVDLHEKILGELGCRSGAGSKLFDDWLECFDTAFQMCSPSLEYPRSDLHPSIRYAGVLPKKGAVIPVAQGTVAVGYGELIMPTIRAFAGRDDVIVIAVLGVRGASLPADFEIPSSARVVDYLPYDVALEHADLFVSNGGYGSMCHGVINAVPMVVAGITEDKVEVTARAEYAGIAVNLKTQTPSSEQIAAAVDRVLANPNYKEKAVRLMKENRDLDCHAIIEREIMLYSKGK